MSTARDRVRRHAAASFAWLAASCVGPIIGLLCTSAQADAFPQDFMHGASPAARSIANFGWLILIVFCVAAVVMWVLLSWLVFRRRGSFDEHDHVATDTGKGWIIYGGLAVPGAVLLVLFIMMFGVLGSASTHSSADMKGGAAPPEIRIVGQQWWFEAQYLGRQPYLNVTAPNEIHIPVGRAVRIELETRDVIHSFWIPRLQGKVDLVPGTVNHVALRAERAGLYHGECAEFCGPEHAKMRLLVVAEPEPVYQQWLARQRQAAPELPPTDAARRGQQVFMTAACPLCHTVRGTAARGSVGPDLTHVGSRLRIAGGALENDTANLTAWVTDAQSLKPGAHMPTLRQMSGQDLGALVSYLQSLR